MATTPRGSVVDRMIDALRRIEGAYSLVALADDMVIGVRDPLGVRPLVLGRLGTAHILASETCAFDIIGAEVLREVEPGELVVLDSSGVHSLRPFPRLPQRFCIFEHIYFARPDSIVEGHSVYDVRKRIGAELASEAPVAADVVIPVPDSGVPAAIGYAQASGIPFELGIIRNHYVGRTFIEPTDHIRHLGVRLKHNANRAHITDKRVVLVDDSIVRGTTSKKIVEMMRNAGATEVHMRISSPPTTHSCFYGIDTPQRQELLAAQLDVQEMARFIDVDSLAFISIDGLYRAMGEAGRNPARPQFCDACFTGDYPTALTDQEGGSVPAQLSLLAETA
jgi:amidophosphoribosyltransferase